MNEQKMIKCPHCESEKLEYYPDVDNASWVRHIYTQTKDGWKIKVFSDEDKSGDDDTFQIVMVEHVEEALEIFMY